jgi:hypothetical protein
MHSLLTSSHKLLWIIVSQLIHMLLPYALLLVVQWWFTCVYVLETCLHLSTLVNWLLSQLHLWSHVMWNKFVIRWMLQNCPMQLEQKKITPCYVLQAHALTTSHVMFPCGMTRKSWQTQACPKTQRNNPVETGFLLLDTREVSTGHKTYLV